MERLPSVEPNQPPAMMEEKSETASPEEVASKIAPLSHSISGMGGQELVNHASIRLLRFNSHFNSSNCTERLGYV